MSPSRTLFIGMAVHKETMAVASVAQAHGAEVTSRGSLGPRQGALEQRLRKRQSKATHLLFVYAAGPGGDWLSRALTKKGSAGWGVAPSLMPTKAGARVKTDRRAAVPLARLARSGERTAVSVPTVADAAIRALPRARDDALSALTEAQCRLNAFVLRHDRRDTGRAPWHPAHLRGRSVVGCPTPAQHLVFQDYGRAVTAHTARRQRLAQARQERVKAWRLHPVVEALQARRGVQGTVAVTTGAALGDLPRFAPPRARMQFLGLMPSAYSRGARRRHGAMPQAGQSQARRARVDGAGAYRYPATVSRPLPRRRAKPPQALPAIRWKAQGRLCQRDRTLIAGGQHANQVVVALAREVMGCMGAIAQEIPVTPSDEKTPHAQPVTQKVA